MPAELTVRWAAQAGSSVGDLGPRFVNKTGTPIKTMERRDLGEGDYVLAVYNGQLVADVYTLTFNADGSLCYVNAAEGDRNPYHAPGGVAITDDGSTPHDLVVPGLRLVFNTCTDTDEAVASVGSYLDASAVSVRALNFGPTKNNAMAVAVRAAVKNTGDRTVVKIKVRPCPALRYTGTDVDTVIARLGPHSSVLRDQLAPAGTKTVTYDSWTDQTTHYTANVKVGGVLAIATAKFDGETVYQHGGGIGYVDAQDLLKGLQVVFAKITADPTAKTHTIRTSDGWPWAVLAADHNGSPATYQNAEVNLGELDAGEVAYVWLGVQVPAGQARGDMRLWTPRLIAEEV